MLKFTIGVCLMRRHIVLKLAKYLTFVFEEHGSRGQSGMTAKVDLCGRCEPTETEP